jgi:hypothetical protein
MNQPRSVGRVQRPCDLLDQVNSPGEAQGALTLDRVSQVHAGNELHRQQQYAQLLAGIVDDHDVWMPEPGGQPGLAFETLPKLGVRSKLRNKHLERDGPVERDLHRSPHDAHSALAEDALEHVASDLGPWDQTHRYVQGFPPRRVGGMSGK